MADNNAPGDLLPLPAHRTHLPHHLPDGIGGHGKIVRRPGQLPRQTGIRVFEVGEVNIDAPIQRPQRLHPLVSAAVVHHRHRQLWPQRREDRGQKVGGGHKIDVFRPLGNEVFKQLPESGGVRGLPYRAAADGGVLAVAAPERAAAEENRAASPSPRQRRFLPFVEHGFGHEGGIRAAAEAPLPRHPVHAAPPRAEVTVSVIHIHPILWGYHISFFAFSQPRTLPAGENVVNYKNKLSAPLANSDFERGNYYENPICRKPGHSRYD